MGKINLAKQNQYVEFAQKDDKGNNISEALKTIGEAIDGKIGFDADVEVQYTGNPAIAGSDIDFGIGTKLIKVHNYLSGIGTVKKQQGDTKYTIWVMDCRNGDVYTGSGTAEGYIQLAKSTLTFNGAVAATNINGDTGIANTYMNRVNNGLYKISGSCDGILFANLNNSILRANAFIFDKNSNKIKLYWYYSTYQGTYSNFLFKSSTEYKFGPALYKHVVSITGFSGGYVLSLTCITNFSSEFQVSGTPPFLCHSTSAHYEKVYSILPSLFKSKPMFAFYDLSNTIDLYDDTMTAISLSGVTLTDTVTEL